MGIISGIIDIIKLVFENIKWFQEEKKYGIIIFIMLIMFVFISPSMSIIFLFKRELFINLDISKLIFICLILNTLLFIILFILIGLEHHSKYILKEMENDRYDCNEIEKINISIDMLIESVSYMIFVTMITWIIYCYGIFFNNIVNQNPIKSVLISIGAICIIRVFNIYRYEREIKKKRKQYQELANS